MNIDSTIKSYEILRCNLEKNKSNLELVMPKFPLSKNDISISLSILEERLLYINKILKNLYNNK